MMTRSPKNLLFPIETINRELDFKVFLAARLADSGRRVFIGQHDVLDGLIPLLDGGAYVGKNIFKGLFPGPSLDHYERLKRHNFSLVHLEEEGAVFEGDEEGWKARLDQRLDPTVLCPRTDFVCTWGSFQKDHYSKVAPTLAPQIRCTGHPRFDLYKQEYRDYFVADAESISRRYGLFVLINTNMAFANNDLGIADTFSRRHGYDPSDPGARMRQIERWAYTMGTVARFCELVGRLSIRFPDTNFVIRPHPSESNALYETVFSHCPNVIVKHEGSVGPWLLAASALVHDGCTTAVEAFLCDKPIINFRPSGDDTHANELRLPNELGVRCSTWQQAVELLEPILRGSATNWTRAQGAGGPSDESRSLFQNYTDDAFERLTEVVFEALALVERSRTATLRELHRVERRRGAAMAVRALARLPFPERRRSARTLGRYFYGLRRARVEQRLSTACRILGRSVSSTLVSDQLLVVEASNR